MKQFKSDGRYKYHNLGLHYIVEFRWGNSEERQIYTKLLKEFTELYGDANSLESNDLGYSIWRENPNWRFEQNIQARRRRIYLKDESVLSLALLRIS